jgi:5-methylcytosine-specific restriction endonuclease McrA
MKKKYTANKRKEIYKRDKNICLCCGTQENLTIDHIIPLSIGGSKKGKNLQTLCKICNNIKGSKIILYRRTNNILRYIQNFVRTNNIHIHSHNKKIQEINNEKISNNSKGY